MSAQTPTMGSSLPPQLKFLSAILDQCPYDDTHYVRKVRMNDHIKICREKYNEKLYREKGWHLQVLNCVYNHHHRVVETEWKFHIERCPERNTVLSHQLMAGPIKSLDPELLSFPADLPLDQVERQKMHGGLNIGHVVNTSGECRKIYKLKKKEM